MMMINYLAQPWSMKPKNWTVTDAKGEIFGLINSLLLLQKNEADIERHINDIMATPWQPIIFSNKKIFPRKK